MALQQQFGRFIFVEWDPKNHFQDQQKRIKASATAKEFTSIPMKLKISFPKKRNTIIRIPATTVAFSLWICPAFPKLNNNGNTLSDIDHSKKNHTCRCYFPKVELHPVKI